VHVDLTEGGRRPERTFVTVSANGATHRHSRCTRRATTHIGRNHMTTKLEGTLKREVVIDGSPYTVTLDPTGLKLVPKGKRKGFELEWSAFVSGDAALATALNAAMASAPPPAEPAKKTTARRPRLRPSRR
jgi:hypothetical protein